MKKLLCILAIMCALPSIGGAHEMTPAYPKFSYSYIEGVLVTSLKLYNRREDVIYYEIGVFSGEWEPIKFATTDKVIKIGYRETKTFKVYIKAEDENKIMYICTISRLQKENIGTSAVSSKICSKIKK
tara:strand:+ start:1153 stop:1536 length:384 start_codon:yes stop_codon:yes gene_type:complete